MRKKSICLFLWLLAVAASYGGAYLYFSKPSTAAVTEENSEVLPVTAGKENFILPETRLVTETLNLKTGEKSTEETAMPAVYLGLEREELLAKLNDYMTDMPLKEIEQGLVSFDITSYSTEEVVLRKTYYPDENFQKYYVVYNHGRIVVYYSDHKTVFEYPDIRLSDLPSDLQCEILSGKAMKDEAELYSFLQNYSS
jgi:hypothetical protein